MTVYSKKGSLQFTVHSNNPEHIPAVNCRLSTTNCRLVSCRLSTVDFAGLVVHLRQGGKLKKINTKPPLADKRPVEALPRKAFSIAEMRKYIDPSPPKEAEAFVQLIYDERRRDGEETAAE